jgi:hypothetical protein
MLLYLTLRGKHKESAHDLLVEESCSSQLFTSYESLKGKELQIV